jgi:hypothetical protein
MFGNLGEKFEGVCEQIIGKQRSCGAQTDREGLVWFGTPVKNCQTSNEILGSSL